MLDPWKHALKRKHVRIFILKTSENLLRYQRFDQGYVNNYQNYPISNHGGINVVSSLARVHGEGYVKIIRQQNGRCCELI